MKDNSPIFGILSSQVGYGLEDAKRLLVRSTNASSIAQGTPWDIQDARGSNMLSGKFTYWGDIWGSFWWVADFTELKKPGRYRLFFYDNSGAVSQSDPLTIAEDPFWQSAVEHMALGQLERRARLAEAKVGWMDAGMPWQEANAHASMVMGLLDLLERSEKNLTDMQTERLTTQIINGCDYMCLLQDEAAHRGQMAGGLSHMIPRFEDEVILPDASKAAASWAMAARLLPTQYSEKAEDYVHRSVRALSFCRTALPDNSIGYNRHQRGLDSSYNPPRHDTMTRELLMRLHACVEIASDDRSPLSAEELGFIHEEAIILAREAMSRQCAEDEAVVGLYGFFFEFSDRHHMEPSWAHQIMGRPIGVDAGATYPQWVMPFFMLLRLWPDHADAVDWAGTLRRFAYGYLLPACSRNPFFIAPLMVHPDHGLIHFVGPWHGMNCVYGLTAAIAMEFAKWTGDSAFREVAIGNLQWISGLNAGVTRESLTACHLFSMDIPEGRALSASMIYGVGDRCAGNWTTIRGSVCNGFAVGDQFVFDVPVSSVNDGPFQLTDEDWIPHASGFLSGMVRLK